MRLGGTTREINNLNPDVGAMEPNYNMLKMAYLL